MSRHITSAASAEKTCVVFPDIPMILLRQLQRRCGAVHPVVLPIERVEHALELEDVHGAVGPAMGGDEPPAVLGFRRTPGSGTLS